jgi:pyruvate carboxylase subunit B
VAHSGATGGDAFELGHDARKTEAAMKSPVKITDTTLRDGHQSLYATRMRTEDMLELAEKLDQVGFHSLEVWGGATFDVMHRFLQENPFERLRQLKKVATRTPLQMLLRGQNLVGYRNYPDDVVEAFVQHSAEAGVDIFRVFDALNDPRNFETAGRAVRAAGKHFQATICFSITERHIGGPVFHEQYYRDKARQLVELGADSLCIKDMAGMIGPGDASLLVSLLKSFGLPVQLHTHFTSGMADLACWEAVKAGVDVIDCAIAPFAYGTSQPAVEPFVVALQGTERDPGIDLGRLVELGELLEKVAPKYRRFRDTSKTAVIDTNVLVHQIPGGMASNMINQLKQADALERLPEVLRELPITRRELGTPPLVTPTSQIVGTQAVMNVLAGRYKLISSEVRDLCYGLYGSTPTEIDPEVRKRCLHGYPRGETPIQGRPADSLSPEMPAAFALVQALHAEAGRDDTPVSMDDVLIQAVYPRTGEAFLRWKAGLIDTRPGEAPVTLEQVKEEDERVRKALAGELVEPSPRAILGPDASKFVVAVGDEIFEVQVDAHKNAYGEPAIRSAVPIGHGHPPARSAPVRVAQPPPRPSQPERTLPNGQAAVVAPMPGTLLQYYVEVGDAVKEGQPLLTLEAMKMANQLTAPRRGTVVALPGDIGSTVTRGQTLAVIE